MKQIFLIFITMFLLISCDTMPKTANNIENSQVEKFGDFTVRIIDSCEYIEYDAGFSNSVYSLTHKGNCKHCAKNKCN